VQLDMNHHIVPSGTILTVTLSIFKRNFYGSLSKRGSNFGITMTDGEKKRAEPATFLDVVEFRDAALLSFVTSAIIVPAYDEVKRDFGIIRAEYMLLLSLSHFPVLTAQDISRLTGRPRNSISRGVHRMLKEGFIERAPDPDDGRQAKLTITATGLELHKKIAYYVKSRQDQVLSVLQPDEREILVQLLRKTALYSTTL